MGTVTTLPTGRAFTRQDLEAMPDDGHRYELIDGSLIVTPAPVPRHQRVSARLYLILHAACPPDLEVLYAPLDVELADDTVLQPDLLIARRSDFSDRGLPVPPLLALEILSPSTRHIDLGLKLATYEAAGCPSYWVVDPGAPSITAWELHNGRYVETGAAVAEEEFRTGTPYPVAVTPARLLD
jgi:Uma2 family endonuclease